MTGSLLRVSAADAIRHPAQTLLALMALAVGVAVFTSVQAAQAALGASLDAGLQRLSGEADLQITGVGGVAELQESLRPVPAIAGTGPVIEQVVGVDDRRLGSLLVMAVDFAGDPRVSNYRLGEEGAETDSLVFIAQPDSIAITRDFAARAGLKQGDAFNIHLGGARKRMVVRGLMSPRGFAGTFGGNVALMDVYAAQSLFARGRTFDRIDVMVASGVSLDDARAQIARTIGPAYQVNATERRKVELERRTNIVVAGFDLIATGALALGVVLVCQVYLVALQRRRRSIGILRAIGATPSQITVMFLAEAAILGTVGGLLGGLIGQFIADRSLQFVGATLDAARGPDAVSAPLLRTSVVTVSLLVGWLAALLAVVLPARAAARLRPVDAISTGVFVVSTGRIVVPSWLLALVAVATSVVLFKNVTSVRYALPVAVLTVSATLMILATRLARRLLVSLGRRLPALLPAIGAIAGDSLQASRRTSMTSAVLIASGTFALGLGGYMLAVRASFDGWIANVMTADLYVRGSGGWGASRVHLPGDLATTLASIPGVAVVDAIRHESIDYRGQAVTLMAVDGPAYVKRVRHVYRSGDDGAFAGAATRQVCVVTDTFANATGLASGDQVSFETVGGRLDLTIVAVVAADKRTVMIDRSVFSRYWRSDHVDAFAVSLAPGTDVVAVQDVMRDRLGPGSPAIIATRDAFADEMHRVLAVAFAIMRGIVFVALVIAVLGVGLSQLAVASERARDIGVLKALGASPNQVRGAALLESAALTFVALILAIPLGDLIAWTLRERVSVRVSGFEFDRVFPWGMVAMLSLSLPVVGAIASWLPAWRLAAKRVAATLSHE